MLGIIKEHIKSKDFLFFKRFFFIVILILIFILFFIITIMIVDLCFKPTSLTPSDLISFSTDLLVGILGFIGSILGVLGAYFIFLKSSERESQTKRKFELEMLCNLLRLTIDKTDTILSYALYNYNDLYKLGYGETLCHVGEFNRVCNNVNNPEGFLAVMDISFGADNFISLMNTSIVNNSLSHLNIDLNKLIYDDNWHSYLVWLKDSNNSLKYIRGITEWINFLKYTNVYYEKGVDDFNGLYLVIQSELDYYINGIEQNPEIIKESFSPEVFNSLHRISENNEFRISSMIYKRDIVVDFLNTYDSSATYKKFNETYTEWVKNGGTSGVG